MLSFFSSRGWESWDLSSRPLIPERMPVLVDDDLRFEDAATALRPTTVVNRWLRELPASGCPAPSSWESYARVLLEWMRFLDEHDVELFDSRARLKGALGRYAEHRATGPVEQRFAATTWGRHMSVLSVFYRWAIAENYAAAQPFTYRTARALFAGTGREVKVNLAIRRTPKPHVTIKYVEAEFVKLFMQGLRGLVPDGGQDTPVPWSRACPQRRRRRAGAGDRSAAAGVHLPAGLRNPCAPTETDRGPDPVPGAVRGDQGAKVPHDLDFL